MSEKDILRRSSFMAPRPMSPAGFPGWSDLSSLEATVWGYLMLPGKRCLARLAKAEGHSRQSAQNAKRRGLEKLEAACAAHGCSFETILDAYRRGQATMANAPASDPAASPRPEQGRG